MAAPESFASGVCTEIFAASHGERQITSRALFQKVMTVFEVLADFLTCAGGVIAVGFLYPSLHIGRQAQYSVSIVAGLMIVLLLERDGAYRGGGSLLQIRMTERALRIPTQALLLLLLCSFLLPLNVPSAAFLIAFILLPLLLIFEKQILFAIMRILYASEYGVDRVVVYGVGDAAKRMVSTLLHSPRLGLRPVAVIDDDPTRSGECLVEMGYRRSLSVTVQSGPLTAALLKSCRCKLLVVAVSNLSPEKLTAATEAAKQAGSEIALLIDPALEERPRTESISRGCMPLASTVDPIAPLLYAVAKRTSDVIVSSLLLLLLAPLCFLIAVLIWLDSPGPIFFVQKRVGRNGEFFDMYKFRSMHTTAPRYDFSPTQSCDTRITPIGRFLRRTSLDELPQLVNVFRGDMSLVGPRPEMPFIVHRYNSRQRQRLQVIPGITGLWQLSADRAFPIHENIQHDLNYIQNRTFFMDIAILVHTPLRALRGGI
jgi:exopolysaccharide biosynthesis polyprenyl glycosylphosphotransferase